MPYSEFAYSTLVSNLLEAGTEIYSADNLFLAFIDVDLKTQTEKDFYVLNYIGERTSYTVNAGWKFHISLDVEIPNNLSNAWDLIKDILTENKIFISKVVKPGINLSGGQRGKEVTIYSWYNKNLSPENWIDILRQITIMLAQHDIKPGYKCIGSVFKNELELKGNNYITYRYQNADEGKARSSMNVGHIHNPYKDADFSDIDQPIPKPLSELTINNTNRFE